MGLLDMLNTDGGLLGLQLMAAGSAKPVRTGFGEGLLGALQGVQAQRAAEEDRKMRKQMQDLQVQQIQGALAQQQAQAAQLKRQQEQEAQFRSLISSPQMDASRAALSGGGGPTMENAAKIAPVDPMQQLQFEAMRLGQIKPLDYINAQIKDTSPVKLGAGETLLDRKTYKPLATNPKEDAQPTAVKEYQFAVGQGYKGTFEQWDTARKRAGATNLNVNTEKPLLNSMASKLGEQIDASLSNAKAATQAIGTAQSMKQALDTGKVISGPGATFRVTGLQLGQMLGVGGKDATEVLSNTRTVIQSMAKGELEAAQQMKGQGQITEAERDIIRRAASGNIDSLTGPEIRLLADSMEKTARARIAAHRSNVKALGQMPNAAPLLPFYQVDEPPAYTSPPASGGGVRRYNPATGRIE